MPSPKIFYFCYSQDRPTGGQKQTYRHVDILSQNGFETYVFHMKPGFRLNWFENQTHVIDYGKFKKIHDPEFDIVVLPEDLGMAILRFAGRKVIFNQNLYRGFHVYEEKVPECYPFHDPEVIGILTVSEHNRKAMSFACPAKKVLRVFNGIDLKRFPFRPLSRKQRVISSIAKAPAQLAALFHTLQSRARLKLNQLDSFEFVFIKDKTESEVARILGDSLIFIFLGVEEGLPLMPLEAMAAGCLVAGPAAGPAVEFIPKKFQFALGDIPGCAAVIEEIALDFPDHLSNWERASYENRHIASRYSMEKEAQTVIEAWNTLLSA